MQSIKGISLWESLLSLMLLSWLLLSILATQHLMLRQAKASMLASVAWQQVEGLSHLLGHLNEEQTQKIMVFWNNINQSILPQGKGDLMGHYPKYSITIRWGKYNLACTQNLIDLNGCLKFDVAL